MYKHKKAFTEHIGVNGDLYVSLLVPYFSLLFTFSSCPVVTPALCVERATEHGFNQKTIYTSLPQHSSP